MLATGKQLELDRDLLARGEKPEVYLDFQVDVADYELIDLWSLTGRCSRSCPVRI